uniref:AT3g07280/T1B9_5 n=1 Tax=Arabidopsis thaliana TaxID=3702 RepID=Q8VXV6_ARATH|nr:AT3g07280/T1B9_5 [Arabidopsis thaliana]
MVTESLSLYRTWQEGSEMKKLQKVKVHERLIFLVELQRITIPAQYLKPTVQKLTRRETVPIETLLCQKSLKVRFSEYHLAWIRKELRLKLNQWRKMIRQRNGNYKRRITAGTV